MFPRPWRHLCLIGILIASSGCDPEALVKRKVPDPIKNILTFSTTAEKGKPPAPGQPAQVVLDVASPGENTAHPAGRPITFRASARMNGQEVKNPDLTWVLFEGQGKPVKPIGRGLSFNHQFDPGSYRVDLTLALPGNVRVTKNVSFRVFVGMSGKVTHNGQGLSGVDLTLTDQKGESVVARAKSATDGGFIIEVPPQGSFRLTPSKGEFNFSPPYRVLRHIERPATADFVGAKAQIQQVRLTTGGESDENLLSVCPEQQVLVKATIKSELPIARLQVELVPTTEGDSKAIPIGEATFSPEPTGARESPEQKAVNVTIPAGVTRKAPKATFGLRITAHDSNNNAFSTEIPGGVSIDMVGCLALSFSEGFAAHERGDLDAALKAYNKVEQTYRTLGGPPSLAAPMEKNFFNKGLVYLQLALAVPTEDVKRVGYLGKAMADFKEVLKLHRKDAPALLFSGLINQLNKHRDAALEDYTSATVADPRLAEAHELKGRVYLETRVKKNLSRAVDEFTEALSINPNETSLRTSRSEILKLDIKNQSDRDDAEVDISSVPLDGIEKRLNIAKFTRR